MDQASAISPESYPQAIAVSERYADGEATPEQLDRAMGDADDLIFCNTDLDYVEQDELMRAKYGDDPSTYPARHRAMSSWSDRQSAALYGSDAEWFADVLAKGGLCSSVDPFRDVAGPDTALVAETIWRQVLLLVRVFAGERGSVQEQAERTAQADLVRDLFGNPLKPAAFEPSWRTATILNLARSIYEEREYDRLPTLADALQEAGCTDAQILAHCRQPGNHVRGCWVVDFVLGKE
jgi:hypothetical protein